METEKKEELINVGLPGRVFFNFANNRVEKLQDLKKDLNNANMSILVQNYYSMVLFYTLLSVFSGILLSLLFIFLLKSILLGIIILLFLPISTFILLRFYPSMEKGSIEKKINEELPFVTIYMSAVASSDLEPTKMFRLIASSKEYPAVGMEMKKVLNQIELYGYSLANALQNVARNTQSEKIAELFSGISINITSGGSLKNYLEKKADNLLVDYKLDRQKYTATAETFMDIYISLLITAPLLLMTVFIIMNVAGFNIPLGINFLNFLIIFLVSILNIVFLAVLHVKQPKN